MKLQTLFRSFELNREHIDEDSRTVELSFSSELPVERHFGMEVLDHSPQSVDLGRLNDGGAVLVNHNSDDQVGVVERAEVTQDRVGRAVVRFGKSARAQEVFQDVVDGIRRNISVGYRILEMEQTRGRSGDTPAEFRATKWLPFEISTVPIPADGSVGVGRNDETQTYDCEVKTMTDEIKSEVTTEARAEKAEPTVIVREVESKQPSPSDVLKSERSRVNEINAIGSQYGVSDLATQFVGNGASVDDFRTAVLERIASRGDIKQADKAEIGLSEKEKRNYSFLRAIRAQMNPGDKRAQADASFELEVSEAAQAKQGHNARGIYVPYDVLAHRDLTAGTATGAAELVGTDHMASSFIDLLRNRMILSALGCTTLDGLVGDVAIPKQTGGASATWVGTEGNAVTESALTTGSVSMTPKTLGVFTDMTRQLILQSSPAVEGLVRNDLAAAVALAVDLAGIEGSGASGQPTGIKNTAGIGSVTFAAADPTYGEIVDLESAVSTDNANFGNLSYLTDAAMLGAFKQTEKFNSTGQTIYEMGGTVNGHRLEVSNQVTDGDVYYGNWSDLLCGFWGGLDILVNPYALTGTGGVRIEVYQSVDVAVRHAESFALGNDGI